VSRRPIGEHFDSAYVSVQWQIVAGCSPAALKEAAIGA
jgi:hypothetical protein